VKSKLWIVNLINFALGVLNIGLLFQGENPFFIMILCLNLVISFLVNRDVSQIVIAIMTYPLGLVVPLKKKKLRFEEVEKPQKVERINLMKRSFKESIFFGQDEDKKRSILRLSEDVEKGKVPPERLISASKRLMKNSGVDVGLYTTESIERVEKSFEKEEEILLNIENLDGESEELYKRVWDYLEADFVSGKLKEYYRFLLLDRLKLLDKDERYFIMKYRVEQNLEVLWEGLKQTRSPLIYRTLLFELLKRRNYPELRQLKLFFSKSEKDKDSGTSQS